MAGIVRSGLSKSRQLKPSYWVRVAAPLVVVSEVTKGVTSTAVTSDPPSCSVAKQKGISKLLPGLKGCFATETSDDEASFFDFSSSAEGLELVGELDWKEAERLRKIVEGGIWEFAHTGEDKSEKYKLVPFEDIEFIPKRGSLLAKFGPNFSISVETVDEEFVLPEVHGALSALVRYAQRYHVDFSDWCLRVEPDRTVSLKAPKGGLRELQTHNFPQLWNVHQFMASHFDWTWDRSALEQLVKLYRRKPQSFVNLIRTISHWVQESDVLRGKINISTTPPVDNQVLFRLEYGTSQPSTVKDINPAVTITTSLLPDAAAHPLRRLEEMYGPSQFPIKRASRLETLV